MGEVLVDAEALGHLGDVLGLGELAANGMRGDRGGGRREPIGTLDDDRGRPDRARKNAVAAPTMPPPMTTTSADSREVLETMAYGGRLLSGPQLRADSRIRRDCTRFGTRNTT